MHREGRPIKSSTVWKRRVGVGMETALRTHIQRIQRGYHYKNKRRRLTGPADQVAFGRPRSLLTSHDDWMCDWGANHLVLHKSAWFQSQQQQTSRPDLAILHDIFSPFTANEQAV